MAGEEGSWLSATDELLTSSLASLNLRDESAIVDGSTNHMVDNPEPHSVSPVMMSSPLNQSQQWTKISMATRPEPSPAAHGKVKKKATWSILCITADKKNVCKVSVKLTIEYKLTQHSPATTDRYDDWQALILTSRNALVLIFSVY